MAYIIYTQIGFSTNRQTFNKNIVSAEKSLVFTSHKSLYEHVIRYLKTKFYDRIKFRNFKQYY